MAVSETSIIASEKFDRVRSLYECHVDKYGQDRAYKDKYGASTTHIGKLLPRLEAGRSGGCPVLAIGITREQRSDSSD